MNNLAPLVCWLIGILTLLFIGFNILAGHVIPLIPLVIGLLIWLPISRIAFQQLIGRSLPIWAYAIVLAVMGVFYVISLLWPIVMADSVFKTDQAEAEMMAIYDKKLAAWPVPYETQLVETRYGNVYVIVAGPTSAPPALLLHASGMASWSWVENIEALTQKYRIYAIDTIGEPNRSLLSNMSTYPQNGEAYADLYAEIADGLGIERSVVVGASMGGFIATNYALHYPERVERLVLLGPMGWTPETTKIALRIMFVALYPLGAVQDNTVNWALGDDPHVLAESEAWFRHVMTDGVTRTAAPRTFKVEELQDLQVPVLLILGTHDGLTGDPDKVIKLAENAPDIKIEVLDSGHMMGIERASEVNELMMAFFE
jgi:pimeloyl-ACP methyl ester carboxylesterase